MKMSKEAPSKPPRPRNKEAPLKLLKPMNVSMSRLVCAHNYLLLGISLMKSIVATGEESELNIFTCKAKLFHFDKVWKERGIGTFKINVRNVDGKETGRMIMRADGAGRVMLNSPIFKGMSYGDTNNKPPSSKQIMLVGTEEGHTVPLLLRVCFSP